MVKWDNKKEDCLVFPPKSVSMYYTLSTLNEAQILKLGAEIKIAQGGGKRPRIRKNNVDHQRNLLHGEISDDKVGQYPIAFPLSAPTNLLIRYNLSVRDWN